MGGNRRCRCRVFQSVALILFFEEKECSMAGDPTPWSVSFIVFVIARRPTRADVAIPHGIAIICGILRFAQDDS